jgi:hypothetical protein
VVTDTVVVVSIGAAVMVVLVDASVAGAKVVSGKEVVVLIAVPVAHPVRTRAPTTNTILDITAPAYRWRMFEQVIDPPIAG